MAISPDKCTGTKYLEEAEREIDDTLDAMWESGCEGITFVIDHCLPSFARLRPSLKRLLIRRYEDAGWEVDFHDGDGYPSITFRQAQTVAPNVDYRFIDV